MDDENFSWGWTPIDPKIGKQKPLKTIEIPTCRVAEGIELCKRNIVDFIFDARVVIENGKLYHAYLPFQFALEEFGKITLIKEALSKSTGDKIIVDSQVFRSHERKCVKAIEKLGDEFRSIYDMNWFLRECLGIWPLWAGTTTSHDTRCKCAFVDFRNGTWMLGKKIDRPKFSLLLNKLEEKTKLE